MEHHLPALLGITLPMRSFDSMSYQSVHDPLGESKTILRLKDRAFIPFDPANTAYQEYLAWLAEGNEPLPADEAQ